MARRCTQWPTSASSSGMPSEWSPCHRAPRLATVIATEDAGADMATKMRSGSLGSTMIVCRHIPLLRLPGRSRPVAAEPRHLAPAPAAVAERKERRVLHAGEDAVRIGQRGSRCQTRANSTDGACRRTTGGCPGRRRSGTRSRPAPGDTSIVGALDELPEPACGLRRVDPVRVGRRALHVVDLPAREVRAGDVPVVPAAVGRQREGAFPRADQHSH